MGKRNTDEGKDIGDVIFGDLMSQMLCFFILLYIFASQTTGRDENIIDAVRTGFEDTLNKKPIDEEHKKDFDKPKEIVPEDTPEEAKKKNDNLEKEKKKKEEDFRKLDVVEKVQNMLKTEKLDEFVDVIVEEKRVRLLFDEPLVFGNGSAILVENFDRFLEPVGNVLKKTNFSIVVEGHTDNVPMHSRRYESNWVLSFYRAYAVVQYYVDELGIPPGQIAAIGYGEFRPLVDNDTPENRDLNRRIEINLLITDEDAE